MRLKILTIIISVIYVSGCSPSIDQSKFLEEIETDLEKCSYFLGEEPYDIERAKSLYAEADKHCGSAKSKIDTLRSNFSGDSEVNNKIENTVTKYLGENIEDTIKQIKSARKFYNSEEARKLFLEKHLKENDPFPYTAVITCSLSAFKHTGIPLMACMSSEFNDSTLRIRNNDDLEVLKGWQIQKSEKYIATDRGLEIPLSRKSSVKILNYSDDLLLSMQVIDNDGNVLYKEVAEKFDTLEFNNFE